MRRSNSEPLVPEPGQGARRIPKLESVLRSELGQLFERELELPAGTLVTITTVTVLPDLSEARVAVSVLPVTAARQSLRIITAAAHSLQQRLNQRLKLYRIPHLVFNLDTSLEQADRLTQLLDNLKAEE